MTRYCPKCRGEFQDRVEVCIDCGTPLVDRLPEPEPEPETQRSSRPIELVTVAAFNHTFEAEVSRAKLESEGIPSIVVHLGGVGMKWGFELGIGSVQLQVREDDADLARQILNDAPENAAKKAPEEMPEEISEEVPEVAGGNRNCPQCLSTDIWFEQLPYAFPFLKQKCKCNRCGYRWEQKQGRE